MNRFNLLAGDVAGEDQILETDIMRFMAIIGIIFWIIFSLVKSIPFAPDATTRSTVIQTPAMPVKPEPTLRYPVSTRPIAKQQKQHKTETKPVAKNVTGEAKKTAASKTRHTKPIGKVAIGLRLEFENLDAMMKLLRDHRIEIFAKAQATGFDLLFRGYPTGKTVHFRNAESIPSSLWEITEGDAYAYFLDLIADAFPSIRAFPQKEVFISFTDKKIEASVEKALNQLRKEHKNGTLSVTGSGSLLFQEYKNDKGPLSQ